MNDEKVLDRYLGAQSVEPDTDESAEADCADCRAFGWLRGIRDRATMLELRLKDGNIVAVGYAWLERADFNPSEGITLTLAGKTIRIKGRHLNAEIRPSVRLFEGLTRHRVPWIREVGRSELLKAVGDETVVESIEW